MDNQNYFVYITANPAKSRLITGVTDDLEQCLKALYAGRQQSVSDNDIYSCFGMVYYERHTDWQKAVQREIKVKGWAKQKMEALVKVENPMFCFLNKTIMSWPPYEEWLDKADEPLAAAKFDETNNCAA
jgi:predicted GIY-YIG superfamily endonuclease